jgi:hypothetical protein
MTTTAVLDTTPSPAVPSNLAFARVWGLSPRRLHDTFWESRGVRVVGAELDQPATERPEVFLLANRTTLVLFDLRAAIERLHWVDPHVLVIRLHESRRSSFVPRHGEDTFGRSTWFEKVNVQRPARVVRVALTQDRDVARTWAREGIGPGAWRLLRKDVPQRRRSVLSLTGILADARSAEQCMGWLGHLASVWRRPEESVERAERIGARLWKDRETRLRHRATADFSIWLGAGRELPPADGLRGPAILWDAPSIDGPKPAMGGKEQP